jgi:uncharacterized protein involved in exopolysaccharide biosynthesis/Mrp family chromosome partitioning ATPase
MTPARTTVREVTTIDLVSVVLLLRRNVGLLLAVFVAFAVLLVVWTLLSAVTFEASGSLLLGGARAGEVNPSGTGATDAELNVPSEIAILSSRSVVGKAIARSGLNVEVSAQPTPVRYVDWLLSKRNSAIIDGGYSVVRAIESEAGPTHTERHWVVEFLDSTSFAVHALDGRLLAEGVLGQRLVVEDVALTLVSNGTLASRGQRVFLKFTPPEMLFDDVMDNLVVSSIKRANGVHSNVITARFTHRSPRVSADFLSALLEGYLKEREAWESEAAVTAKTFIKKQADEWAKVIQDAHAQLIGLRTNDLSLMAPDVQENLASQHRGLADQYSAGQIQARSLAHTKQTLLSGADTNAALFGEDLKDATLNGLNHSLLAANAKLDELLTKFSPQSPEVVMQQGQVRSQLAAITQYIDSRLVRARERQTSLAATVQQLDSRLTALPSAGMELDRLQREAKIYDGLHKFLLEQQQVAVLEQASTLGRNRILDAPRAPSLEQTPNMRLRLEGLPLGLLAGVGLVLMSYFATGKYQSLDVVGPKHEQRTLGAIPTRPLLLKQQSPDPHVVHNAMHLDERLADSVREVRLQLKALCATRERGSVIVLTSPGPGDGKTTIALLLAWALADNAGNVLYWDANLRSPSRLSPASGGSFVDVVSGQADWSTAVTRVSANTGASLLLLQPAAPIAPELLVEDVITDMLRSMTGRLDFVIIDAPSGPPFADLDVLAARADVVISVIRVEHTERSKGKVHLPHLTATSKSHAVVVNGGA